MTRKTFRKNKNINTIYHITPVMEWSEIREFRHMLASIRSLDAQADQTIEKLNDLKGNLRSLNQKIEELIS